MRTSLPFSILLSLALLLSACAAPATAAPSLHPTPSATSSNPVASTQASAMPCLLLHQPVTPEALGAGFEGRSHITGPENAPVTIIVFGDFQCSACALLESTLRQVRQDHQKDVRLVFVNTPSGSLDKDALAMQAAEAADLQGKYWEMHDLLFEKQAEWVKIDPAGFETWAASQAGTLGMDSAAFKKDFESAAVQERLQQALQAGKTQPVTPPVLFVNSSSPYTGYVDFYNLDQVIRMEALAARQFSACPAWVISASKQYIATLHTAKGDVVIQLLADKAPLAVNNFVFLARSGWYDGDSFYRVIPDQIIQSGDPSETGMGNPGYLFQTESPAGVSFEKPGVVALDNSGAGTNGSRFFITLAPAPNLDGQYTIIGQVLQGLDVLKSLAPRDPAPGKSLPAGDLLEKLDIEEH